MLRSVVVSTLIALFLSVPSGGAEVRVVVGPPDGPADFEREVQQMRAPVVEPHQKTTETSYKAWVPFFVVDTTDPDGTNTLFAVRNRGTSAVSVTFTYLNSEFDYGSAILETVTLDPRETKTVSIRTVAGIPVDPATGLKTGCVEIEESTMGGEIAGDWFRVDGTNNFASGDRLISFDSFCDYWDSRFFNGGPFDGGTTFSFWLGSNLTGGTTPIVVGQVYDEPGNHLGTVQIYTADQLFEVNTSELPGNILGTFGTIEWTIQNPYGGYVMSTYRALGRYSVTLASMCVDNAVAP